MKKTIPFIAIVALLGCESSPVRRAELIEQHPEWSTETGHLITEGFLVKGMTPEHVKAAWGSPCKTCTGTVDYNGLDVPKSWEYQTQVVFFDKEGKVTHWAKK